VARVRSWCVERIPEPVRDQIRVDCDVAATHLTIVECRPPWRPGDSNRAWTRQPVARLRYTKTRREWSLYWTDRNGRFHCYDRLAPSEHVTELLAEVDSDPTCIFWG
jgi:hypothetical protein